MAKDRAAFHAAVYNPCEPRLLASANAIEGVQLWDLRRPLRDVLRYGGAIQGRQSAMSVRWDGAGRRLFAIRRKLEPVLYNILSAKAIAVFDHESYFNCCTMKTCCFAGLNDEVTFS